jgi:hypothetical protein
MGFLGLYLIVAGCGEPASRPLTKDEVTTLALSDVGELYRIYTAQ